MPLSWHSSCYGIIYGNLYDSETLKALIASQNLTNWIIDIGLTNRIMFNSNMLDKGTITKNQVWRKVYLHNGYISLVTHTGTITI